MALFTMLDSPIGPLTLVGGDGALSGLYMAEHRHGPAADALGSVASDAEREREFGAAIAQLDEYFAGERTEFQLLLEPHGTDFQRTVWQLLLRIGYGETWSYQRLAEEYGDPKAIRAVAAANGRNPLSIIVPCHRVIGSDGSLVGYGGGLERKRFLLDLEHPPATRQQALF